MNKNFPFLQLVKRARSSPAVYFESLAWMSYQPSGPRPKIAATRLNAGCKRGYFPSGQKAIALSVCDDRRRLATSNVGFARRSPLTMGHSAFVIRTGPTALLRGSHGGSPDSGRRFAQNPAPFMASGRYLSSDTIDLDELRTRLRKIYESQRFSPFPKDSQPDSMRVGFENRRSTSNGALDTFSSVAR